MRCWVNMSTVHCALSLPNLPRMNALCRFWVLAFSLCWFQVWGQTEQGVGPSIAWDVSADPRNAAIGGLDVAPLSGDGWTVAVNPTALDSTVERQLYTSYLDYFAGIRGGAVTLPLQHRGRLSTHAGIRFMNYGRFDETTASGDLVGRFSGGDYAVQGGATWSLDSLWTVGVTGYTGLRNLEKFNAGVLGMDVGVVRRSPDGLRALGLLVSNLGFQTDFSGIMPDGRLPHNLQVGWTQSFPDAPFTFHLRFQRLETWDLAPDGTYDDTLDPLTGEIIPNGTWVWGDQFFRHLCAGVTLNLGPQLRGHVGYNHQRQKTMAAAGRTGLSGMSLGIQGSFKTMRFSLARSVYHLAGGSTHLGLVLQLPKSPSNRAPVAP